MILALKKLSFIVIGLFLLVALMVGIINAAEQVTRYYYRDITTTSDNASYFSRHWYLKELGRDLVKLNSLGFRDPEPDVGNNADKLRVAVIGDSYTFGPGIAQQERFTDRLNARFDHEGNRIHLVNLGRNGAGPRHYLRDLQSHLQLQPDFVLLQWFVNDFEVKTNNPAMKRPSPRNLIPRRFNKYHHHYHRTSTLYYVLNRGWHNFQYATGRIENYADYMDRRFGDPDSAESTKAIRKLTQVINAFKKADIPMGLVLFPMFTAELGTERYRFGYLHDRVLELCKKRNLRCLDLRATFAQHITAIDKLVVNQFDGHPSSFSNEIASTAIYDFFSPDWNTIVSDRDKRLTSIEAQNSEQ